MSADQTIAPGLVPQPEQPLSVETTVHGNQVVLHLSQPREYVAFTGIEPVVIGTRMLARAMEADSGNAEHVLQMAMSLMDVAYEMRGDLKPAGGAVKHELIERHRRTLTTRISLILNSRREKKRVSNAQLAKDLVDVVLNEVFS